MPTNETAVQHTPGPWRQRQATGTLERLISGSGESVCRIPYEAGDPSRRNANADLICAAPDLLAALVKMVEGHSDSRHECPCVDEARAAIAKAEGR